MRKIFLLFLLVICVSATAQYDPRTTIYDMWDDYNTAYTQGDYRDAEVYLAKAARGTSLMLLYDWATATARPTLADSVLLELDDLAGKTHSPTEFTYSASSYLILDSISLDNGVTYYTYIVDSTWVDTRIAATYDTLTFTYQADVDASITAYNDSSGFDSTAFYAELDAFRDTLTIPEEDSTWVEITADRIKSVDTITFETGAHLIDYAYDGLRVMVNDKSYGYTLLAASGISSTESDGAQMLTNGTGPPYTPFIPNRGDNNSGWGWVSEDKLGVYAGTTLTASFEKVGAAGVVQVIDSLIVDDAIDVEKLYVDSIYMVADATWTSSLNLISGIENADSVANTDTIKIQIWNDEGTHYTLTTLEEDVYPHVGFGFADSTVTLTAASDEWVKVTNAAEDLFITIDSVDFSVPGDSILVAIDGDYILTGSLSFSGNNGETWKAGWFKNNVLVPYPASRYTSNNDTGNVIIHCYTEAEDGDYFSLRIMNITDNDDPVIKSLSATIICLHE